MRLVLLPGMDGTGTLFAPLQAALGDALPTTVIRYPTSHPMGYAALTAHVGAALPRNEDFVLLAESFSGPIGIALAAAALPGLRGLALCASFARNPRPLLAPLGAFARLVPIRAAPLPLLSALLWGRWSNAVRRAELREVLQCVTPAVLRARMRAVLSVDASGPLAAVRVPLLYLQASADRLVPPASATHVLHIQPSARVVRIEAPHFLLQVAAEPAAAAIRAFAAHCQEGR